MARLATLQDRQAGRSLFTIERVPVKPFSGRRLRRGTLVRAEMKDGQMLIVPVEYLDWRGDNILAYAKLYCMEDRYDS